MGRKVTTDLEVMVIDDGSEDDTWEVLSELKESFPDFKLVRHKHNMGYGAALRSGFKMATKEFVFYTDGDSQYDPLELRLLVEKMSSKIDVVNGYKISRKDSIGRIIVGKLYNGIAHREFDVPISDVQCDFRLMRSSILKKIVLESSSGTICLSLVVKLVASGARFTEVGVHHYPRPFGTSQFFRPKNLWRTAVEHVQFFLSHYRDRKLIQNRRAQTHHSSGEAQK